MARAEEMRNALVEDGMEKREAAKLKGASLKSAYDQLINEKPGSGAMLSGGNSGGEGTEPTRS